MSQLRQRKFVSALVCVLAVTLGTASTPARAATLSGAVKFIGHHLAPLRSNPLLESSARPCSLGVSNCFVSSSTDSHVKPISTIDSRSSVNDGSRIVYLEVRTLHRGPLAHHWIETETATGKVTIGYGPATLPFIDAGQVSLQDEWGNIERISGMHPVPPLGLPPLNYRYARKPGEGRLVGKPIVLTKSQAEALVQHLEHQKFVVPYIPIFHDCRTFACKTRSAAEGRSSLPCYLLFRGYW